MEPNLAVTPGASTELFDAMKEQNVALSRDHIRQKSNLNFRESQMRIFMRSLIKVIQNYKNKEEEDRLYEQQIMSHL